MWNVAYVVQSCHQRWIMKLQLHLLGILGLVQTTEREFILSDEMAKQTVRTI